MADKVRVVLLGTPEFAVPTLEALCSAEMVNLVLVVTQPDRPVGRKHELLPSAVKRVAQAKGIQVAQPAKVSASAFIEELNGFKPDVLVTAAYGQILSERLLAVPVHGCLNVHASLLPRWRGAAPIHRALMAGDQVTGVTIMQTVKQLDAGPVLAMESVPIEPSDTVSTLHDTLAELGSRLLVQVLPEYVSGKLQPSPQPEAGVTYAHRVTRQDEAIQFTRPATEVHNQIRALSPTPGATARFEGQAVKLLQSRWPIGDDDNSRTPSLPITVPGTVQVTDAGGVFVCCSDDWLELLDVQPAGKRPMPVLAWLRGLRTDRILLTPMEDKP